MTLSQSPSRHIEISEMLVRFYVFLAHYLDRLTDPGKAATLTDQEMKAHLDETKQRLVESLAVNRVVRAKVEREYTAVLELGQAYRRSRTKRRELAAQIRQTRAGLQWKMTALSDLLAVLRVL